MRARLKGPEQLLGVRHAGSRIAKTHHHQVAFRRRRNAHHALLAGFQRPLTIARQIDEDLQQAVMVGLHQGEPVSHLALDGNAGFAHGRFNHDARLVQHGAEIGHYRFAVGSGAQAGGSEFFEPADQRAQDLILFVALHVAQPGQCRVRRGRGGSQIPDLVGDGADQHARGGHHGIQARAFAVAQVFGGVPNHRGQSGAAQAPVSGEPHVGQEDLSIAPVPLALDVGADTAGRAVAVEHAAQDRQIRVHRLALQRLLVESE